MSRLRPFAYPTAPHRRRHGPGGYKNYQDYKDWLRDEFCFRCAYCLARETWYPNGQAAFSVEHLLPRSTHPHLELAYDNLVYACLRCNSYKQDRMTLDPTAAALAAHVRVGRGGKVSALTVQGGAYVSLFDLNHPAVVEMRLAKLLIVRLKRAHPADARIEKLFAHAFGYPQDLPDLRAKRPESNSRPDGLRENYFWQRAEGLLGRTY
jgi:hypothetical protein